MHAQDSWVWQVQSSQLVLGRRIAKQRINVAAGAQDINDLNRVPNVAEINHIIVIGCAADIGQQFGARSAKGGVKLAQLLALRAQLSDEGRADFAVTRLAGDVAENIP
jgi:hypothetical protein